MSQFSNHIQPDQCPSLDPWDEWDDSTRFTTAFPDEIDLEEYEAWSRECEARETVVDRSEGFDLCPCGAHPAGTCKCDELPF